MNGFLETKLMAIRLEDMRFKRDAAIRICEHAIEMWSSGKYTTHLSTIEARDEINTNIAEYQKLIREIREEYKLAKKKLSEAKT